MVGITEVRGAVYLRRGGKKGGVWLVSLGVSILLALILPVNVIVVIGAGAMIALGVYLCHK